MMKRHRQSPGFTVIELIFAVFMTGILILLWTPQFRRAVDRSAQRSTMDDISIWGHALTSHIVDHGRVPRHSGQVNVKKSIVRELSPYLRAIRTGDRWRLPFCIWTGPNRAAYGLDLSGETDFIIASFGKGGIKENWVYDPAHPEKGLYSVLDEKDFEKDLVMSNMIFIRKPDR